MRDFFSNRIHWLIIKEELVVIKLPVLQFLIGLSGHFTVTVTLFQAFSAFWRVLIRIFPLKAKALQVTEEKDVVTHRSTLVPGGLSGSWKGVHSLLSFCGHHPFLLQANLVLGTCRVCLRVCLCRKCSAAWNLFLPSSDAQVSEPFFFKHLNRCRLDKTSTPTSPFC